jgi:opacity protein-like surface antigen
MRWITRMFMVALACVALSSPAHALKMTAIDAMTSTVMQEKQSSFSGVGVRTHLTSPVFIQGIEFMPAFEYWRNANTVDPFGIRTTRKDVTLAVDVGYSFKSEGTRPYLGLGYAVHFLSASVDYPSQSIYDTHALTKGGFSALGGVSFPLTQKVGNFLELKYHHIPDYRQLKFNWGISFNL